MFTKFVFSAKMRDYRKCFKEPWQLRPRRAGRRGQRWWKVTPLYFSDLMSLCLKVIAADGEMRASKALREASQIIEQSPAALQLRYLQVCNSLHFQCKCLKIYSIYISLSDAEFNIFWKEFNDCVPASHGYDVFIF